MCACVSVCVTAFSLSLSAQFCAELNEGTLSSVRRWKLPRGLWRCVVSDEPTCSSSQVRLCCFLLLPCDFPPLANFLAALPSGRQLRWLPVGQPVRRGPEGRRCPGASGCQRQRQHILSSSVSGSLFSKIAFRHSQAELVR